MKKLHLLILLLLAGFVFTSQEGNAQQVDRQVVIVEIGTGTWCGYCPGAALGADDLVENGHAVAIIENHNGDSYANDASNARNNYYAISGYPTSMFDGVLEHVGGNASSSIYTTYLPLYEQRIAVPSSFVLEVGGEVSGTDITIGVDLTKVADYAGTNIVLQIAITESHIPEVWNGLDELNFVNRMMIPSHNGTPVDFGSGDMINFELADVLDASWDQSHMEVVVFIQDNDTKEILQGFGSTFEDLEPLVYPNDGALSVLGEVTLQSCQGEVAPCVTLTNSGIETLTSCDFEYAVNEFETANHSWSGSLAAGEAAIVNLPAVNFDVLANNELVVNITNVNGDVDPNAGNNVLTAMFPSAETTDAAYIAIKTDNNPDETTWELFNGAGELILSGGPYTQANSLVLAYVEVETTGLTDCFSFVIHDSGNNGLTDGDGYYTVMGPNSSPIYEGSDFADYAEVEFTVMDYTGVENVDAISDLNIYPNPTTTNTTISFNLVQDSDVSLQVFDSFGRLVFETNDTNGNAGSNEMTILTEEYTSGIYFVKLVVNETTYTERLIVK